MFKKLGRKNEYMESYRCIACGKEISEGECRELCGYCRGCFGVELDEIDHDAMPEETMGEEEPY